MKKICITTRSKWRRWLAENHDSRPDGIWLVFYKKATGRQSLEYGEAVEEALCFGWIDSIIKRIDDEKYCRKFTPRKDNSNWSATNKKRVAKLIKEGLMTDVGMAKVRIAKKSGMWNVDSRPAISTEVPEELSRALGRNRKAREFFETLAPTYRNQFIGWIATAKRPETKAKRVKQSVELLAAAKKLGMV